MLEDAAEDDIDDRVQCIAQTTDEIRDITAAVPQIILNDSHTDLDKSVQAESSPYRQSNHVSTDDSSCSSPSVASPSQSALESPVSSPLTSLQASPPSSPASSISYSCDLPISEEEQSYTPISNQARVMPKFHLAVIEGSEGVYPHLGTFPTEFNEAVTTLSTFTLNMSYPDTKD